MTTPAAPVTPAIDRHHAALLAMDLQVGILGYVANPEEIIDRAAAAIQTARSRGVHIGYVRVAFEDSDYAAMGDNNKMFNKGMASMRMFPNGTPATAVHDKVRNET